MKDKNLKIKFIQGFIDFCNADLDNLTITEKTWWAEKFIKLLDFDFDRYFHISEAGEVLENDWNMIKDIQKKVSEDLDWVYKQFQQKDMYIQTNIPRRFSPAMRDNHFGFYESWNINESITATAYWDIEFGSGDSEISESKKIHFGFNKLFEALEGFKLITLAQCPICKKIFFNPTDRFKIYCKSRCQNTAAVRRLREREDDK